MLNHHLCKIFTFLQLFLVYIFEKNEKFQAIEHKTRMFVFLLIIQYKINPVKDTGEMHDGKTLILHIKKVARTQIMPHLIYFSCHDQNRHSLSGQLVILKMLLDALNTKLTEAPIFLIERKNLFLVIL